MRRNRPLRQGHFLRRLCTFLADERYAHAGSPSPENDIVRDSGAAMARRFNIDAVVDGKGNGMVDMKVLATGLRFPEGPVALADGSMRWWKSPAGRSRA